MDDSNVWIVLECPRGAERELASQGESGYVAYRESDSSGKLHWLKYVPLQVARHLAGEFGGKGGYNMRRTNCSRRGLRKGRCVVFTNCSHKKEFGALFISAPIERIASVVI
jgi:hypothetical protein